MPLAMAALPEGWEADYDGTRWFYRYKPLGLTQYRFPKDGDVSNGCVPWPSRPSLLTLLSVL